MSEVTLWMEPLQVLIQICQHERWCEVDRLATHLSRTFRVQLDMMSETKGTTTCSFFAHVWLRAARRGTLWGA